MCILILRSPSDHQSSSPLRSMPSPIFLGFKVLPSFQVACSTITKKIQLKYHEKVSICMQELFNIIMNFGVMDWKGQLTHQQELTVKNIHICTVTVQITKSHTKPISRAENGTEDEELCRKILALAQFFVAKICTNYKAWWDTRLQDHLVPIPKSAHSPICNDVRGMRNRDTKNRTLIPVTRIHPETAFLLWRGLRPQ